MGVLLALFLAERTARVAGLDSRQVWKLCVVTLFAALVTSRLLLVALNWTELRAHPLWMLTLAMVHHPLLSCFGALVAVVAGCFIWTAAATAALDNGGCAGRARGFGIGLRAIGRAAGRVGLWD